MIYIRFISHIFSLMWIFAKALSVRNLLKKKNLENGKGMKLKVIFGMTSIIVTVRLCLLSLFINQCVIFSILIVFDPNPNFDINLRGGKWLIIIK